MSYFFPSVITKAANDNVATDSKQVIKPEEKEQSVITTKGSSLRRARGSAGTTSGALIRTTKSSKDGKNRKRSYNFKDGVLFSSQGTIPMLRVPTNNEVFRVMQEYEILGFLSSSTTLSTFAALSFVVNSLDQISSLTGVFDQYLIERIEVKLTPRVSVAGIATSNTGFLHSVIDFDDANALSTIAQANDYPNCVAGSGVDGHYRTWVPHFAVAAYSGAFTSFLNSGPTWIDAASPSVQHYGLKTAWSLTDSSYTVDAWVRLHTVWRNVR